MPRQITHETIGVLKFSENGLNGRKQNGLMVLKNFEEYDASDLNLFLKTCADCSQGRKIGYSPSSLNRLLSLLDKYMYLDRTVY